MSDIGVRFRVGTEGAPQAAQGLDNVAKSANSLAAKTQQLQGSMNSARITQVNFNRVIQDAPYGLLGIANNIDPLVSSFQRLREETGSTGGAMKALIASFSGPAGIISIISLVVAGLTTYTLATRGSKEGTDSLEKSVSSLTKAFNSLVKIENPFEKLQLTLKPEQLEKVLGIFEKRLEKSKGTIDSVKKAFLSGVTDAFTKTAFETGAVSIPIAEELTRAEAINQAIVDSLKQQIDAAKALNDVYGALKNEGLEPTNEEINKSVERIPILSSLYERLASSITMVALEGNRMNRTLTESFNKMQMVDVVKPSEWFTLDRAELEKNFEEINIVAKSAANALRAEFMGIFDDIFGHANNLFINFLKNVLAGLSQIAAQKAASGIFDFLLGALGFGASVVTGGIGAGALAFGSGLSGAGGLVGSRGSMNQTTIVQIGDKKIAEVVTQGNKMAQRLRY